MWLPQLPDTQQPRYLALVDAIALAIERGELAVGERLPPQRRLAWALGLNPSTTMQAYREAARRHLVSGEVGRGTYVLAGSKEATLFQFDGNVAPALTDLRTNLPAIDPHNNDGDQVLQRLAAQGLGRRLDGYLDAGDLALGRALGAQWLQWRGVNLPVDHLLLCPGAQQGLFSALLSLCQAADAVLVEAFTAPGIKAACAQLRLPLHGVAMDRQGIVPDDFERMIRATGARVAVLTPTLQNPTGAVMSSERQARIAAIAVQHDVLVIEDDVYGALTSQPPLLTQLGKQGLLVTSLSKTVAAGLRIGWLAGDPAVLERIDPHARATHWGVSPLCLATARQWFADGTAQRRLAWQVDEVQRRWRVAGKVLGAAMPTMGCASPHLWLPTPGDSEGFARACQQQHVQTVGAQVFATGTTVVQALRLSLTAASSAAQLKQALDRIAPLWVQGH